MNAFRQVLRSDICSILRAPRRPPAKPAGPRWPVTRPAPTAPRPARTGQRPPPIPPASRFRMKASPRSSRSKPQGTASRPTPSRRGISRWYAISPSRGNRVERGGRIDAGPLRGGLVPALAGSPPVSWLNRRPWAGTQPFPPRGVTAGLLAPPGSPGGAGSLLQVLGGEGEGGGG